MPRRSRYLVVVQTVTLAVILLLSACNAPSTAQTGSSAAAAATTVSSATASVTGTATSSPTAQPSAAANAPEPLPANSSATLPPGAALPSEATCAARVHRSSWEPRPANIAANSRVPTAAQIAGLKPWGSAMGMDSRADALRKQMKGNFTGTTDEILQWAACKWGFNPDVLRADAVVESYWQQSQRGDYTSNQQYCPPGSWDGAGCFQSYGLFQIKWYFFKDAFPMAQTNTAFSAEYAYGILRACYEGWTSYLKQGTPLPGYPSYRAGDLWGCLGRWYSGWWYTQDALQYIAKVKTTLANKTWKSPNF
jgi:hypothetical protein